MTLAGKKIAVLAENNYQELELWYPLLRLREEGAEVRVVGPKGKETYQSKHGYPATSDLGIDEAKAGEWDAIIIPGGFAPDLMRRNAAMVNLVRESYGKGKLVAAICHAGWMLVSANILRGKKATCFYSIKDDLVNAGAQFLDQEVVRDGNLITSRNPMDLPAFCRKIIEALREK